VPKGKAGIMGRWEIEDRRWKMEDGRWKMEDGRWKQKKATDAFSPRRQGGKIEDGSKRKKVVSSSGLSIVRRNGGSAAIDPRYILGGFQTRTGTQPGAAVLHYFQISSIFFASLFPLPSSI